MCWGQISYFLVGRQLADQGGLVFWPDFGGLLGRVWLPIGDVANLLPGGGRPTREGLSRF